MDRQAEINQASAVSWYPTQPHESHLPTKVHIVKAMVFPVVMYRYWELDHKEGWAVKNWCFWIMVLEKAPESPLDNKEIKLVNPKGNKPWMFIGRTGAKAEALILWPPDTKSRLTGKDADVGKDWRQKRREQQRLRWLDIITDSMDINLSKFREIVEDRGAWRAVVYGVEKSRTQLSD